MNPELVYCRTPEGERLARSPRQIASYANRATLLLLDGQISVGELLRRFGETLPIEEALGQLERECLIHLRAGGGVAEEVVDVGDPGELPAFDQDPLFDPEIDRISEEQLVRDAPPEATLAVDSAIQRESELERAAQATAVEVQVVAPVPVEAGPMEEVALTSGAALSEAIHAPELEEGGGAVERTREARRSGERKFRLGTGGVGKLAGVALVVAFVAGLALWLAGLRPQVEARASAALGVPVSVRSLGLAVHHGPALALNEVTIGLPSPLVLPRVEVRPILSGGGLFSSFRVLVSSASLKPSEVGALAALMGKAEAVSELEVTEFGLRLGDLKVGGLDGGLVRGADGVSTLHLADPAGGLSLELRPSGSGVAVNLATSPGVLTLLGRPQVGTATLRGVLEDGRLVAGELGLTGYGGKFDGTLNAAWAGPVSVDADLRMAAVSMSQVSRSVLGRGGFSEGVAAGTVAVHAKAARWEELTRIDRLDASFTVERGALKGFDLGAALRERSPRPIPGGETRFESLRGRLEADPRNIRLWIDRLDSGALTASGQLSVDSFESLQGSLSASVQVPGRGTLQYPALVSGTVALPAIQLRLPAGGMVVPVPGGAVAR